jgi:hypothetical protein
MAQAESVTTAIRELMSRRRPSKSTSPRPAHIEFIATLAANVPHAINSEANSKDLERRADHLEKVFTALHLYLAAILADTGRNIPGSTLDRRYLEKLIQEFLADTLSVIRNAAAEMRAHENGRVS